MKTPFTKLIAAWAVSALMALQSTVYAADQTVQIGDSAAPEVSVGTDAVTEQISDDLNVSTNDINNSEGDLTETIRLPSCAQINQAICKSTQDPAADDTYDIDGNGVINAFDNVLRKRQLLESQSEYAHLFVSKAVGYGGDVVPVTVSVSGNPGFQNFIVSFSLTQGDYLTMQTGEDGTLKLTQPDQDLTLRAVSGGNVAAIYSTSAVRYTDNGELFTVYVEIPENTPVGVYPLEMVVQSIEESGNQKVPYVITQGAVTVREEVILPPVTATTTTVPLETTTTTTVTTTSTGSKGQIYDGIDVSKWQGTVDWAKVKADGYHFAIIRAGYGREASQVDPTFATNVAGAKKAGLYCGAYWYSYATDAAGAKAEAELFLKTVKGYQFDFPLVFDIEDSTQQSLSKSTVAAIIDTFCSTVENAGYYCTLYSYASFLTNNVPVSCQSEHDIWVAHTKTEKPAFSRAYGMWQYSHTGTVNGVSGSTDLNYAYKDYPAIMQKYGFNGFKGQ